MSIFVCKSSVSCIRAGTRACLALEKVFWIMIHFDVHENGEAFDNLKVSIFVSGIRTGGHQ